MKRIKQLSNVLIGGTVAQRVEVLSYRAREPGLILTAGTVCAWNLHVLPVTV